MQMTMDGLLRALRWHAHIRAGEGGPAHAPQPRRSEADRVLLPRDEGLEGDDVERDR